MTLQTSSWAPPAKPRPSKSTSTQTQSATRPTLPHTPPKTPPTHAISTISTPSAPSSIAPSATSTTPTDLARITRLLRRLRWKATSLSCSYARAAALVHGHVHPHDHMGVLARSATGDCMSDSKIADVGIGGAEAEAMFKVDFFEFYVLLERILVLLLEAVGVSVHSSFSTTLPGQKGVQTRTLENSQHAPYALSNAAPPAWNSTHRFHANLLTALSTPSNPLYEILGTGSMRHYLGLAKELRNRWKDADAGDDENSRPGREDADWEKQRHMRLLEMFDLPNLLETVLQGLEEAVGVVRVLVVERERLEVQGSKGVEGCRGMEEVPWEAVGDAMEWELG